MCIRYRMYVPCWSCLYASCTFGCVPLYHCICTIVPPQCTTVPSHMYHCTTPYVPLYHPICTIVPTHMYQKKTLVVFFLIGCVFSGTYGLVQWYIWSGTMVHMGWYNGTYGVVQWYIWGGTMVHMGWYNGTYGMVQWYIWSGTMVHIQWDSGTHAMIQWYIYTCLCVDIYTVQITMFQHTCICIPWFITLKTKYIVQHLAAMMRPVTLCTDNWSCSFFSLQHCRNSSLCNYGLIHQLKVPLE